MGKHVLIIKVLSVLLNIFSCLIIAFIVLIRQDFFGSGDIYAFLFWTLPIAGAIGLCGEMIVYLTGSIVLWIRSILFLLIAVLISYSWIYGVYLFLGPWINTFSIPIFYIWILGILFQLIFLNWGLRNYLGSFKKSNNTVRLLLFPVYVLLIVLFLFGINYTKEYLFRPEKEVYLLPTDFEGRFRVIYGEKCGETPLYEQGRRIMKIPENGILIIKPRFESGVVDNEYYRIEKDGSRTEVKQLLDYKDRLSNLPGVIMTGSGSMAGSMPNGNLSTESPLAIHFTDFHLFNKDTTMLGDREFTVMETKFDSLTTLLVEECRNNVK